MKKFRPLPSAEYLRERLNYDPDTGILRWRTGHCPGKETGKATWLGYRLVGLPTGQFPAHRVIWKLVYDLEPEYIDHLDGNRSNNALANLRSVTRAENARNARMRKDNSSGICGVDHHHGKWRARIHYNGKSVLLGYFETQEEAARARAKAERKFGFSRQHGAPSRPHYEPSARSSP